ncbi:uncharacterized protein LOC133507184 isoform X2 [Syngnathoides biaculeatus]|uniref:uncharacterized protein LOC133507184 isoform X2 n=1 Tax=Syngnathoides biaculeatus TaxID=300417 RepID=UPI002ADE45D2|nr:uncharacterized protein LOC133507184 isoform X2 [Syngnathoides biaculeatus]
MMLFALLLLICGFIGLGTGNAGSTSKSDRCPVGWTQLDNRCYIYKNESLSFHHAEWHCKHLGGDLVYIHSSLESVLVHGLIGGPLNVTGVWIRHPNSEMMMLSENETLTTGAASNFSTRLQTTTKPPHNETELFTTRAASNFSNNSQSTTKPPHNETDLLTTSAASNFSNPFQPVISLTSPEGYSHNYFCIAIAIHGRGWYITDCDTKQPYVCARDVFQCVSICKEDKSWH